MPSEPAKLDAILLYAMSKNKEKNMFFWGILNDK